MFIFTEILTANKHVKQIYLDHMDVKILKMGSISGLSGDKGTFSNTFKGQHRIKIR